MDLLMKFDVDTQIKKNLADPIFRNNKSQYIASGIPPIEVHLCCSNIRHKTCFKAFQSLELYLGYCVKKNCTVTNSQLNGEGGKPSMTQEELKARLDPN